MNALAVTRERIVRMESAECSDRTTALRSIARRSRVRFWTLHNIRRGRAKTVEASIFEKVRTAYLDWCEQQIAALQHEITIARKATPYADFDDLDVEVARLRSLVAARRHGDPDHGRARPGRPVSDDFLTGAGPSSSLTTRR